MLQVRNTVHCNFDWNRNLLLHLFGGTSGPLRDDLHVIVGYIGVGLHWKIVKCDQAPDQQ